MCTDSSLVHSMSVRKGFVRSRIRETIRNWAFPFFLIMFIISVGARIIVVAFFRGVETIDSSIAGCLLWTKLSMITIRLSSASLLSSAAAAFVRRRAAPWRASRKCTTCRFRGSDSTTQIRGFVVQTNCPTPTRSLTILTPWLSWLGRRTRSSRAIHCTASPLWPSPRSNPCWLSMRTSLGRKRSRLERSSACCYVVPARPRPPPTRRRCPRADEQFGL
mmetsp:Transcript_52336/g.136843  ORF Transcript_52336/g.136843 Transcript_52336/m.136843 type:complete len:219 (-) Transcript_52336:333-989(-)